MSELVGPPLPTRPKLERAGIKIAIGVPMPITIDDDCFAFFWNVAQRGWPLIYQPAGRRDENRNQMAAALLKTDFTHICMLDADHLHPPVVVEHLARWVMQDRERLVVAGLNFRRSSPHDPCIFQLGVDGKRYSPLNWDDGLFPVDATGHGAILIAREVFERLERPWWWYDYSHAEEDKYPSEDMTFSHKCRANGIDLWVDTTCTSPHHGDLWVGQNQRRRIVDEIMRRYAEAGKEIKTMDQPVRQEV